MTYKIILLNLGFLVVCGCTPFSTGETSITGNTVLTDLPPAPLTQDIAQMSVITVNGDPITSKDTYLSGHLSILANGTALTNNFETDMKIKGRGNFTWSLPKKPYKIKLTDSKSIMGFPAEKEWILLANYVDKTLVRTAIALEFSRRVGLDYTPRSEFVDLILNGVPSGSYTFIEQIKGGPDRVNITAMKATDIAGEAVTGGYLIELNGRLDEKVNWTTTKGTPYSLKEPSAAVPAQVDYIRNYIQLTEDVLYSAIFMDPIDGYAKYIDVDSFIQLYLVHELFKNKDAANFGSIYLQKERNQKLKMGPAWDFDIAAGNSDIVSINNPEGWWLKTDSPWYKRLFEDPAFVTKVKIKWNSMKTDKIDTIETYIDQMAYRVTLSQQKNFVVWDIMNLNIFPAIPTIGSHQGEVEFLKQWLRTRTAWIDQNLNAL